MHIKYEWLVVAIFFIFILTHNADRYLISPLVPIIMDDLGINPEQFGLTFTAALIVTTIGFLVWGYLYESTLPCY
mgnify:CR=1 FL=1